jgi:hypothetical protein
MMMFFECQEKPEKGSRGERRWERSVRINDK